MSSLPSFLSPSISDADVVWITSLLGLPEQAFCGTNNDDPRLEALRSSRTMDVEACPGSGKTTLLVAKLGALSKQWHHVTQGICVLSHTNVARHEIERGLGMTPEGQRLMAYPHFVGTIYSFVNEFLALPWLRSKGIPIRVIDDEICLARRWAALSPALRGSLESAGRDRNVLRAKERDFSVGDLSWGRGGTLGRDTSLYRAMQQVCRSTSEQGFFCYEEMFIWANELLDIYPRIADALRYRFPLLFVDEVQDNSEAQSALLHRTFVNGNTTVIRQRFGDINQAIFGYAGQEGAASDIFPSRSALWPIPNSHRFGQQIADFANPFAVIPQALVGHGPSGKLVRSNTDSKHTIFLFDDQSLPFVMDAYANYLAEVFDADELRDGIFTAVGAVHKTGDDTQRPRNVGHYWPDYDHELTSSDPKPQTLYQHVGVARKRAREFGDAHDAVQKIAEAVLRLARLANPLDVLASSSRCHLQILELLKDNEDNQTLYREFQTRVAINNAVPEIGEWKSKWVPTLRSIAETIFGGEWTSAADAFLRYPTAPVPEETSGSRDNVFRRESSNGPVKIRVGSIHSVKGETHTATLVLDTFYHQRNFKALKPWLLGRTGGAGQGAQNLTRLKQHYVAMTRPTHLLCVAIPESTFTPQELAQLQARGWRLARVGTPSLTWL